MSNICFSFVKSPKFEWITMGFKFPASVSKTLFDSLFYVEIAPSDFHFREAISYFFC